MDDRLECRQCRTLLAHDANFCPVCGLARGTPLLDPLGVGRPPDPARSPTAARSKRLAVLVGVAALAGLAGVAWAIAAGGSRGSDPKASAEPADGSPDGESEPVGDSATTSRAGRWLVADAEGPVLDDDIEGVLIAFLARTMHRVDLSTGAVTSVDLDERVATTGQGPAVVVDNALVSVTLDGHLITTDLVTGSQRDVVDLGVPGVGILQVIGTADPDSVWVTLQGGPEEPSVAFEVGLDGQVLGSIEFAPAFRVLASRGRNLYLSGPDGSLRYDSDSRTAEDLGGQITTVEGGVVVLVECEPTLRCHVEADSGSGLVPMPHLSADDLLYGAVNSVTHVAPDLGGAIVPRFRVADPEPSVTYIDLTSGERTEIVGARVSEFGPFAWMRGHPWVVGFEQGGYDLVALNTDTAAWRLLDLPGGLGPPGGSFILWDPIG